ncbi:hypothetical protein [Nocardia sp. alder85J]|uniref:hypothetical protein n=1 Tax=Nocardia sp. alder85J TaxID=2862949 RepID=UPI001CD24BCA|nr:hypothetical protein [Nocardia sp. alder85J]MCX4092176.1 hypothetical protein [Nocardia sp. alder85J]
MTAPGEVTVADTIRWLHDEGLVRLTGVGDRSAAPVAAYTVSVATGVVTAYPSGGIGAETQTFAADDLPYPTGTPRRLVVVGVTAQEAVLVVDLAVAYALGVNASRPEPIARAWLMQLLLNPEITISTNSGGLAVSAGNRCRQTFIPGGGAMLFTVDDRKPPASTVTLNPVTEGADHLDVDSDGSGELYLGSRFWQLRLVLTMDDGGWALLTEQLESAAAEPGVSR